MTTTTADPAAPSVITLDAVPGCFGSVRFDHALHVRMSTITEGCANCHHELPAAVAAATKPGDVAPRACPACHDAQSSAVNTEKLGLRGAYHRQCLSCHKDWAHENGCGFCHPSSSSLAPAAKTKSHMTAPRATPLNTYVYNTAYPVLPVVTFHHDDHTDKFGLSCVECHANNTCGSCHGERTQRPIINRQRTCYNCHTETRCVTCHGFGERPKFDHGKHNGWYLRPAHASLGCRACHPEGAMPSTPASDTCRACHAKRWNDDPFNHARTGVALDGDHALFECVSCHDGGDRRMLANCAACHIERPPIGERRVGRQVDRAAPSP
ncbi:MAG: cytochrome c3 family protein [Planctomycetota bacterium]|nr:cytochrome c3 family protein [Planctomycetota bacterium]